MTTRLILGALRPSSSAFAVTCSRCGTACYVPPGGYRLIAAGDAVAVCEQCPHPDEVRSATVTPR